MESNKERQSINAHAFGKGIGFYGEGARTFRETKIVVYPAEPYGSNPFRFTRLTGLPTPEQDWRMIEDPNEPGVFHEIVMLNERGPNAKRLHGN